MRDWKEATTAFATIAASWGSAMTISDSGAEPERHLGAAVSWDLFPSSARRPSWEGDSRPRTTSRMPRASPQPPVVEHALSGRPECSRPKHTRQRQAPYRHRRDASGVRVPREPAVVDSFLAPRAHKDERQARYLFAFGRLNPDVSQQRATEDLDAIAGRLAQQYPVSNEGWTADVSTPGKPFFRMKCPWCST